MTPPKPTPRPDKVSLWRYLRLFRRDILSAQPAKLYRAWMAEFRTPFFRSYLINQPDLIKTVLKDRPMDFPKSDRVSDGLRGLLGNSVFLTNGDVWEHQRRIIDPAFEGGRLRDTFPAMAAAGQAAVARLHAKPGVVEIEAEASHAAADVIFRALFSVPINDATAAQVFAEFQRFQQVQPILSLAAFVPLPRWLPRPRRGQSAARRIRTFISDMTKARMDEIRAGTAPDDLATKIMTTPDPETGQTFSAGEMADQVAIFFLAGHETSAAALGWALYLLATHPEAQRRVRDEALALGATPDISDLSKLTFTRNVFRETLRLYPPVPMLVRQSQKAETFRSRTIGKGAQIVISPWHLHRHTRIWERADDFDPDRFDTKEGRSCMRDAFIPFSAGARVCPGAGFAMAEGALLLALLVREFDFTPVDGEIPVPVAHLTTRSLGGILLNVMPRGQ